MNHSCAEIMFSARSCMFVDNYIKSTVKSSFLANVNFLNFVKLNDTEGHITSVFILLMQL